MVFAFSALTLLVVWQEGHLACKTSPPQSHLEGVHHYPSQ